MNLYNFFKDNIELDRIKDFCGDMYELALVRYVMKEASKFFYRDYTFFLNKENIKDRDDLYNKKIDISDEKDFSIVCKSYCDVIKELLKQLYGIDSEIISAFDDRFRHVDLMIKTKSGKKYIVDPLTDLVEMQVGLRTNNFTSKKYYESFYAKILEDISFLTDEGLEQIDNRIGYKNDSIYLDEYLDRLRINLDNPEMLLKDNEQIAITLLGSKYDGRQLLDNEKIELKLKYICNYLNNRRYINGFVDLIMFSKITIKKLFSEEEQKRFNFQSFFVDETDLNNKELENIIQNTGTRKRGCVINFNGKNYIFSLNQDTLIKNDDEWQDMVEKNKIFIKAEYHVQLLKYLKSNGADRNIVHNNEFLRLFNRFETYLLNRGETLEDIKNNIVIKDDAIITKLNNRFITYSIEDNHLVVRDFGKNKKYSIFYEDEGRNISYRIEPILENTREDGERYE